MTKWLNGYSWTNLKSLFVCLFNKVFKNRLWFIRVCQWNTTKCYTRKMMWKSPFFVVLKETHYSTAVVVLEDIHGVYIEFFITLSNFEIYSRNLINIYIYSWSAYNYVVVTKSKSVSLVFLIDLQSICNTSSSIAIVGPKIHIVPHSLCMISWRIVQ